MWFIPPDHPSANMGLVVLGKLLLLCNKFEETCKGIVMWVRLSQKIESHRIDLFSADQLNFVDKLLGDKNSLGSSILQFKGIGDNRKADGPLWGLATQSEIEILDRAREARNFICHQANELVSWKYDSDKFQWNVDKIREKLNALIEGEYLVSKWNYEFHEKNSGDFYDISGYKQRIIKWVLDEIENS